jgi:ribonuclease P protein component
MVAQYCLTKQGRLLTPGDYAKMNEGAVRASSPELLCIARKNGLIQPRLGLVIPKKAVKHAVGRNRIKRLSREVFRQAQHDIKAMDILFIARKGIDKLPNQTVTECLKKLLFDANARLPA